MQSMLLPLMLKTALVLLAALVILYLQRDAAAAQRHRHLAAALLALLTLPVLELLPEISLAILPHTSDGGLLLPKQLPALLLELYVFGVIAGALMLISRHLSMRALLRRSCNAGNAFTTQILAQHGLQSVRVCESSEINGPVSYGLLRPHIIVPMHFLTLGEDIIDAAMNHEIAHIRRRDCLLQLFADIVLVLNWCNPLAWLCIGQLREQSEFSSDDDVLELGGNQHRYAEALVSYARLSKRESKQTLACDTLRPAYAWLNANLKSRIHALLQQRRRERSDNARLIETSLLYLFLLLPLSVVHAVPQPAPYKDFMQSATSAAEEAAYTDYIIATPQKREIQFVCGGPASELPTLLPPQPQMRQSFNIARSHISIQALRSAPVFDSPQLAGTLNAHVSVQGEVPVRSVIPAYPKNAQRRGIEGYVIVAFDIDIDGSVYNAKVADAQPSGIFDKSALAAIKQSQFKPLRFASQNIGIRNASTRFIYQLGESKPVAPDNNKLYPFHGPTLIASAQPGE